MPLPKLHMAYVASLHTVSQVFQGSLPRGCILGSKLKSFSWRVWVPGQFPRPSYSVYYAPGCGEGGPSRGSREMDASFNNC